MKPSPLRPSENSTTEAWTYSGTVLALFVFASLAACGKPSRDGPVSPPTKIASSSVEFALENPQLHAFQTIEARSFKEGTARFTGQVVWNEDCTNRVFSPVAGRIEKVVVEPGQRVRKGDDLALMRSPDYGQAQADYRKAMGDFAQFDRALARVKTLREHGAAAVKDVESAQANFDRGLAEKQRAESRLRMLGAVGGEFNDLYHVVAPIDGVVVTKNVNIGQEVRSDIILANSPELAAPMFTLTDPSKLWTQLDVPESELRKLRIGQPVAVQTSAYPGRSFQGRLETIGASLDPQTRVARARASIDNSEGLLKAGMYVSVDVKDLESSKTEVQLPARAVIFLDGKYFVFVETNLGKFEKREVKLSGDPSASSVVVSGVQAGEHVVSEGALLLNDLLRESEAGAGQERTAAVKSP